MDARDFLDFMREKERKSLELFLNSRFRPSKIYWGAFVYVVLEENSDLIEEIISEISKEGELSDKIYSTLERLVINRISEHYPNHRIRYTYFRRYVVKRFYPMVREFLNK